MTLTREQKKQKRLKNKFFSYISRLGIFAVETAEIPFFYAETNCHADINVGNYIQNAVTA